MGGEDEDVARCREAAPANAHFHGYVVPAMLRQHYDKADVCVAPYQATVSVAGGTGDNARWMSPLKLFEYMSQARPIVASDIPVIREVLTPGEDALLCDPNDFAAWQAALVRLRDNSLLRTKLALASLENATNRFSWSDRATRILKLANERMAKAGGAR
ncbi:MAG: glycosyltransferase [Sphingomicrobium sp.]